MFICRNIGARELMALVVAAARAYRRRAADTGRRPARDDARGQGSPEWSAYRLERDGGGRHG